MNTSIRGRYCEDLVVQYYLKQKYTLLFRRLFHGFAELDLVFLSQDGALVLVEVKSMRNDPQWLSPLHKKQELRLKKAWMSLQHSAGDRPVEFHLALVDTQDRVEILRPEFA